MNRSKLKQGWRMSGPFSLTLALSRGEREDVEDGFLKCVIKRCISSRGLHGKSGAEAAAVQTLARGAATPGRAIVWSDVWRIFLTPHPGPLPNVGLAFVWGGEGDK
jgi:hypothetical protein